MSKFGTNGPLFLKTYGKYSRKVEAWLSPDIRKMAFASTSSSDFSIGEQSGLKSGRKRKKILSTASSKPLRAAKKKALLGLREKDSDEENLSLIPEAEQNSKVDRRRKNTLSTASSKPLHTAEKSALTGLRENDSMEENDFYLESARCNRINRKRRGNVSVKSLPKRAEKKRMVTETTSESEEENADKNKIRHGASTQRKRVKAGEDQCLRSGGTATLPSYLGKFVNDRRRGLPEKPKAPQQRRMKTRRSVCISNSSLNSSEDFVKSPCLPPRFVDKRKKRPLRVQELCSENTSSEMPCTTSNLSRTRILLKEVSLNKTADRVFNCGYKKPLLSSTPSLTNKQSYKCYEPSISEISFSNDEMEDIFRSSIEATRNFISPRQQELKVLVERSLEVDRTNKNHPPQSEKSNAGHSFAQNSKELLSQVNSKAARANGAETMVSPSSLQDHSSRDCDFVSAKTHLDSFVALKEGSRALNPVVSLDKNDVSKYLKNHCRKEEVYSSCVNSELASKGNWFKDNYCSDVKVPSKIKMSTPGYCGNGETDNASQVQENDELCGGTGRSNGSGRSASVVYISTESESSQVHSGQEHVREMEPNSFCTNDTRRHDVKSSTKCSVDYSKDLYLELSDVEHQGASKENLSAPGTCISPQAEEPIVTVKDSPPTVSLEAYLKERCLSLQPTVTLNVLDLSKWIQGHGDLPEPVSAHSAQEPVNEAKSSKSSQQWPSVGSDPEEQPGHSSKDEGPREGELEQRGGSGNNRIRRRLSNTFASSQPKTASVSSSFASTAAEKKGPGRVRTQGLPRDKMGTGRKACISGLSVSRWTKKDHPRQRQKKCPSQSLQSSTGDCSLFDFQLAPTKKNYPADPVNGWFQGTSGILPGTPVLKEPLNMSSFLANFTPQSLNTHTWRRLKAALSVHKKKKAFFTPKKLQLSQNESQGGGSLDLSADLWGSSQGTPLSHHMRTSLLNGRENPNRGAGVGTLQSSSIFVEDITDAEKVYHECHQEGPISFEECIPPHRMKLVKKIGEGAFGEVFSTTNDSNETVALKIIPIEGSQKVNGEDQKTFGEILHEVIISKELSSLDAKDHNKTNGFIGLNNLHCVRGSYPKPLLSAWDKFDKQRGSENDRPDFFEEDQLFLILEFEFGGSDLENMNGKLSSLALVKSILHQVTAALAVAEQALHFEHRDLHWGNILVKTTKEKEEMYVLNGTPHSIETKGIHVNIIDYSLSRLEIDDLTVSCDISNDEELFMGQGDYQFDIYRKMREENKNNWNEYNPHTNVLWLHYLSDKLLHMSYKNKGQSKQMKSFKKSIADFHKEVLGYKSATNVLECCSLFQ
ncbi:hypothetical protein MATL_G00223850 [Megalops atlanticus]|uniref:Serine/threonine-protein kinase haspin n=1 Tax=Megalops atlanticus TaxID=7932 RepID=A0A9D3PEV6_MEGAT|nr:hypothetical protein MATL_G00223850 [Megalops atlanticus]